MSSQFSEEEHILARLGNLPSGKLLDIGAWDPVCFSNSRALLEKGWGGILIEPSPVPLWNLMKAYKDREDVTIIAAAVGLESGLAKFKITADAVSSADEKTWGVWKDAGGYVGQCLVPMLTLADIFARFGGDFGFINIDTEGSSVDLALQLFASGVRPKCLCVEHDSRMEELCSAATTAHMHLIYSNGTNGVFTS